VRQLDDQSCADSACSEGHEIRFENRENTTMAKIAPRGSAVSSLYREVDLLLLQLDLSLPQKDKRQLRSNLQLIVGQALGQHPYSDLQTKQLATKLRKIARSRYVTQKVLRGLEGFNSIEDIEIAIRVRTELEKLGYSLHEVVSHPDSKAIVSQACLVAAKRLATEKGNPGRRSNSWYDDFIRLMVDVARKCKVRVVADVDWTRESKGPFLTLVATFEDGIFPPRLRALAPSLAALIKRVDRSLDRLDDR
jgi:hypothetical protein